MIFQGIRTSIAKKPYIFVIFYGGSGGGGGGGVGPPVPPLDQLMEGWVESGVKPIKHYTIKH